MLLRLQSHSIFLICQEILLIVGKNWYCCCCLTFGLFFQQIFRIFILETLLSCFWCVLAEVSGVLAVCLGRPRPLTLFLLSLPCRLLNFLNATSCSVSILAALGTEFSYDPSQTATCAISLPFVWMICLFFNLFIANNVFYLVSQSSSANWR